MGDSTVGHLSAFTNSASGISDIKDSTRQHNFYKASNPHSKPTLEQILMAEKPQYHTGCITGMLQTGSDILNENIIGS